MGRVGKGIIWVAGLALLAFLIQYPIQKTETTWKTWSLPLAGKTIVLDPGHGAPDGGAEGTDDTQEKDVALAVTKKIRDYLQQSGALVYMTRETDADLADEDTSGYSRRKTEDIRKRLAFIQDKHPDLFVSVHLNAIPAKQWSGAQTFYDTELEKSKHLATMIQSEIIRNLENTNRSPLAVDSVYLLKHIETPGSLVEIGFLSNEQERDLLKQDDYQLKMAGSIYEGILRYVTEDEKDPD